MMKTIIKDVLGRMFPSSGWKEFVVTAHNYLSAKQEDLIAEYKLGKYERFDWDQENGTLVFSDQGKPVVIAKVQFVGSFSSKTKAWLWAWANPSILDNVKDQLHKIQAYGEEHQYKMLTKDKWFGSESDGWDMTSITSYLLQAKGAYRTPAEAGFTYMVITDIYWADSE